MYDDCRNNFCSNLCKSIYLNYSTITVFLHISKYVCQLYECIQITNGKNSPVEAWNFCKSFPFRFALSNSEHCCEIRQFLGTGIDWLMKKPC